ncbi:hypothetical protein Dole_2089 [Desulfosudis oleivorans Hxd3]|uniref:Type II CBASS E2 protein domain-containing protein n=1 Tax=Desulfosudis oleivorans (strain DSM 6200 / JCM 39069 / Hxd3) TaxID=96561 RepID=A8ZTW0_DESOH|nr:hypothetical protein Dole_2089 [Desulfosudis oleivorans Hxd3]
MKNRYFQHQCHSLAAQLNALRMAFPEGKGAIKRSQLIWVGNIQPTPLSRTYTVEVSYRLGKKPKTRVISPSIRQLAGEREIPHLYSQKEETLCLFLPWANEWSQGLLLSKTIIPWAYTWFFYFEHWLETDEWMGGGVHPTK